ncbi:hypothetical protein [Prescottella agglutinans]|uniref:Uncharacterized protein n=1 Tax=Prescottella agglutinans TaxID=1644129 RepID=A0ABT6MI26_9NOCA|nr:hypothetical protein [Prescottella agglutinans]MDH6283968.1 hypothetical protein [Prescottella agglutinans]
MTTTATIADLDAQLAAALELPEGSDADVAIETASIALIAAILRAHVPAARHMLLDWSCQGPHHEAEDITDAEGNSLYEAVDAEAPYVMTLATNLRGEINDRFEAINADGGVYRVDLSNF